MSETHSQHHTHITPLSIYLGVGGALIVLTAVTVAVALVDFGDLVGLPQLNIIVALGIATVKASLVALFFMHLLYDSKIYSFALVTGLLMLFIFIGLTMADTLTRESLNEVEGGTIQNNAAMYETKEYKERAAEHKEHGHAGEH